MGRTDTVDRLRADIDRGRTGDKRPGCDPAAAPLGSDDEAAGTSLPRGAIAEARRTEGHGPVHRRQAGFGYAWVLVAASCIIAVVLLSAILGRG